MLSAKIFVLIAWRTPPTFTGTIPKSTYTSTSKRSIPGGMFCINIKSKAKQYVNEWVRTSDTFISEAHYSRSFLVLNNTKFKVRQYATLSSE